MSDSDLLIAGLGNPGSQYQGTRHNVGFMAVDYLAARWKASAFAEKWQAEQTSCVYMQRKIFLIKPLTYMNLSGRAIAEYLRFYKIPTARLLVIHDDLDMAPGRVKLVSGGGAGGHNGIKSIVDCIGTPSFYRLKIGIGRPGMGGVHPGFPVEKYVLSVFSAEDLDVIENRMPVIQTGVEAFILDGAAKAMNILNILK
jgi:PTH1 family peptidyl-tRNA hydrolase